MFEIGAGEVHIFPGNYEDYVWRKGGKPLDVSLEPLRPQPVEAAVPVTADKNAKRVNPMKLQKIKDRCQTVEGDIARSESTIASLEAELGEYRTAEESLRIARLLDEQRAILEKLMSEWENLSAEIEAGG